MSEKEMNEQNNNEQKSKKSGDIAKSIAESLSQYNTDKIKNGQRADIYQSRASFDDYSFFGDFFKAIFILAFICSVVCIAITLYMKPQINAEYKTILEKISNAQEAYYSINEKYYYFSKTPSVPALKTDMSSYKFFDSCEVVRGADNNGFEINIYGSTNVFYTAYYTIKAYIDKNF